MSNDNIDEFAELREIFTKYTFSLENDKIMVKFGDFSRNYDEKLSVEIHSVIEKYEKFSFITTTEEAIIFNFSTFNITTNLVDYSIDFEYSEGDVGEFDFIDFIAEYEKLFNESQELRERFNNYDICVTIDLKLMAKFRDMTSFEINNINQNIHNKKRGACARYLNLRRDNHTMPSALFVVGDSGVNIRELKSFVGDSNSKDKMVANAETPAPPQPEGAPGRRLAPPVCASPAAGRRARGGRPGAQPVKKVQPPTGSACVQARIGPPHPH
jgi:hypothetical protein